MKKNKVTVVEGSGTLTGATAGDASPPATGRAFSMPRTSSSPPVPAPAICRVLPADGLRIWTYRHAMVPPEMPTKLLVIGSGAIGVEFASFYNDMGAKVTIVEMLDRMLPVEDEEVSAFMHKALTKQGMRILTGTKVSDVTPRADEVTATITTADGKATTESFSHVIVAIGIVPNTENIGLEALGVATDRGHIVNDGYGRTNVPGLWAIGDVAGAPWLAHKASHEGIIAVETIAGLHVHPMDKAGIPGCTYSRPQVASVGMTEAKAQGRRAHGQGRQIPLHRQWQGDRAGRGGRLCEDRVRCRDRRIARRAHGRRRSHRADPGLCHRARAGDHRTRTDAHRLRASHAQRNDA